MITIIILFHIIVAVLILKGYKLTGEWILIIGYFYGIFERPIKRIVKKIIQVAKDDSND